jgi:hypothetical protein
MKTGSQLKRSGFRQQSLEELKEKQALKLARLASKPRKARKTTLKPKRKATGKKTTKKRRVKSTLSKLKAQLWQLCRQIQIKKYGNKCYTCPNQPTGSGLHLGHFIPSSTCSSELRYSLDNLRPQCYRCNIHLSGNWVVFERHLTSDHGEHFVKELKARNELTKGLMYREDFYIAKIAEYTTLLESL